MSKAKTLKHRPLTVHEATVVVQFAGANGRDWKWKLNVEWMYAKSNRVLHCLRNSHGPSWLADLTLSEVQAQVDAAPRLRMCWVRHCGELATHVVFYRPGLGANFGRAQVFCASCAPTPQGQFGHGVRVAPLPAELRS